AAGLSMPAFDGLGSEFMNAELRRKGELTFRSFDSFAITSVVKVDWRNFDKPALSPDAKLLAVAGANEDIYLIDRADMKAVACLEGAWITTGFSFSSDSTLLAAGCSHDNGGLVNIYDVSDPKDS